MISKVSPKLWNIIPFDTRVDDSLAIFRKHLKYLFHETQVFPFQVISLIKLLFEFKFSIVIVTNAVP